MSNCIECSKLIEGRLDKTFCSNTCKSKYHYKNNKLRKASVYTSIDHQLKLNRRILKKYTLDDETIVLKSELIEKGFIPKFFTHYWKTEKGEVYLFCYEFGFLAKTEDAVQKYFLLKWKEEMN